MTKSAITVLIVAITVFFASCSNPAMPMMDGKAALMSDETTLAVTDLENVPAEKEIAENVPAEVIEIITVETEAEAGDDTPAAEVPAGAEVEYAQGNGSDTVAESAQENGSDTEVVSPPANGSDTVVESAPGNVSETAIPGELNTDEVDGKNHGKGKDNGNHYGWFK